MAVRTRQRPPLGPIRIRVRVLTSYTKMLPGLLRTRRKVGRAAVVDRAVLEKWLVTER